MIGEKSHSISYGKRKLSFEIKYATRKYLRINVHPNNNIEIIAPVGIPEQKVLERVKKKAPWINKQLEHFSKYHPLPTERKYVSGETHKYLGKQYRLKIKKGQSNTVKLISGHFLISIKKSNSPGQIRYLLQDWYLKHAKVIFEQRLKLCYEKSKSLNVSYPNLRLRRMRKRWCSCNKNGDILLNTELVKAPLYCIDYVIMHELCHLKVNTHNNGYYKLLSKYMPDWEKRKERLETALI